MNMFQLFLFAFLIGMIVGMQALTLFLSDIPAGGQIKPVEAVKPLTPTPKYKIIIKRDCYIDPDEEIELPGVNPKQLVKLINAVDPAPQPPKPKRKPQI